MILISPEPAGAGRAVDRLLDRAFGPQRRQKTAERLREGRVPAAGLSFAAIDEDGLVGTIRFWHVRAGSAGPALLLGPLAVDPARRQRGVGSRLIKHGLRAAGRLGHRGIILVGDAPYYGRFGFCPGLTRRLCLPGPVDRPRFLGLELRDGSLAGAAGLVQPTGAFAGRPVVAVAA